MDYKKEKKKSVEKALDEGITNCYYESGKKTKEVATGESGSVYYPNKETITNYPDLLEHPY